MKTIDIGNLIKQGRLKKGLSQTLLAEKLGVTPSSISRWEQNQQVIAGDTLIAAAKLLDIIEDLFPDYGKLGKGQESETRRIVKDLEKKVDKIREKVGDDTTPDLQILVVEDEYLPYMIIQEAIFSLGLRYYIVNARNGEEAIYALKHSQRPISLIILDLLLPDMNGIELLEKINENDEMSKIPVIICTGSEKDFRDQALYYGVRAYMQKPFEMKKFSEMIKKIDLRWPLKK